MKTVKLKYDKINDFYFEGYAGIPVNLINYEIEVTLEPSDEGLTADELLVKYYRMAVQQAAYDCIGSYSDFITGQPQKDKT